METLKRIYVAGPISNPDGVETARNIERGEAMAAMVMEAGYAPYSPFSDSRVVGKTRLTLEEVYGVGLSFLVACHAVLVLPDYKDSIGTQREIDVAIEHGIPVYYHINKLIMEVEV